MTTFFLPLRLAFFLLSAILLLFAGAFLSVEDRDSSAWFLVAVAFLLPAAAFVVAGLRARTGAEVNVFALLNLGAVLLLPDARISGRLLMAAAILAWCLLVRRMLMAAELLRPLGFDIAFRRLPANAAVAAGSMLMLTSLFLPTVWDGAGYLVFRPHGRWLSSEAISWTYNGYVAIASVVDYLGRTVYLLALMVALVSLAAVVLGRIRWQRRTLDALATLVFIYFTADVFCGWCNLSFEHVARPVRWLNFTIWLLLWLLPTVVVFGHGARFALDAGRATVIVAFYSPLYLLAMVMAPVLLNPHDVGASGLVAFHIGAALLWWGRAVSAVEKQARTPLRDRALASTV